TRPNACLNIAYLPFMDWVYYESLKSVFQLPITCSYLEENEVQFNQGFFLVEPHYTFANVKFDEIPCKEHARGISILAGKTIETHWILSAMFDYGRSSNRWHPQSSSTKDSANRWSLAPSITYQFKNAYIQGMILGMFSRSKVTNAFVNQAFSLNHWGLGTRLDGAIHFDFFSRGARYALQPYLCIDYFAAFQQQINSPKTIYVKNAQFFQAKGLIEFFTRLNLSPHFCFIPQASIGLAIANSLSRNSHSAFCDLLPSYPYWTALSLGCKISLLSRAFI